MRGETKIDAFIKTKARQRGGLEAEEQGSCERARKSSLRRREWAQAEELR